jgi:hypothetical protein|tara:strand:- start:499 stop:780 length:282 start_codon:yes stop_codon:yes gene_type:complete
MARKMKGSGMARMLRQEGHTINPEGYEPFPDYVKKFFHVSQKKAYEMAKTLHVYNMSGKNWVRKSDCLELFNSNVEAFPIERPSIALEYEDET